MKNWNEEIENLKRMVFEENLSYDRHYVETFNGAKNAKMMKYENLRSAGSTLKSMVPLSKGKNGLQKFGIATRNVFLVAIPAPKNQFSNFLRE